MASFELTTRAAADLEEYTRDEWGVAQCARYLDELETSLERLAEAPGMGRPCKDLPGEYLRFEVSRHVVFYRKLEGGIRVVRILHERMLPERHLGGDDPSAAARSARFSGPSLELHPSQTETGPSAPVSPRFGDD